MSIVVLTCPLDFHHFPGVILVPLSSLHKGTIVSAPSPSLFEVLRMTCLRVVLGIHQRHSLTFFCLCPGICSRSHPIHYLSLADWTTSPLIDDSLLVRCCDSVLGVLLFIVPIVLPRYISQACWVASSPRLDFFRYTTVLW